MYRKGSESKFRVRITSQRKEVHLLCLFWRNLNNRRVLLIILHVDWPAIYHLLCIRVSLTWLLDRTVVEELSSCCNSVFECNECVGG
jgi:hypothetical protein